MQNIFSAGAYAEGVLMLTVGLCLHLRIGFEQKPVYGLVLDRLSKDRVRMHKRRSMGTGPPD
jgi:hypothetical protein